VQVRTLTYWYGRPESLLAQTLAETQKKGNETNLKLPKKYPQKTREIPSMVANFVVGGKSLLRSSTKGLIMHAENNHLKASTFFYSPNTKPHIHAIQRYKQG
jgi:hypothetical protein